LRIKMRGGVKGPEQGRGCARVALHLILGLAPVLRGLMASVARSLAGQVKTGCDSSTLFRLAVVPSHCLGRTPCFDLYPALPAQLQDASGYFHQAVGPGPDDQHRRRAVQYRGDVLRNETMARSPPPAILNAAVRVNDEVGGVLLSPDGHPPKGISVDRSRCHRHFHSLENSSPSACRNGRLGASPGLCPTSRPTGPHRDLSPSCLRGATTFSAPGLVSGSCERSYFFY